MNVKPDIRERLLEYGAAKLTDTELLAVLLRTGTAQKPVTKLAEDIIHHIDARKKTSIETTLHAIHGIGNAKMATILAAFELGRRYYGVSNEKISHPHDIVPFLRHYAGRKQEQFICSSLNGAHEILAIRVVSVGTLTHTLVHPREVFADVLEDRAAAVILAHNHPSGTLEPSIEDLNLTRRLTQAGELLGIKVLDHIILAPNGTYISFIEQGYPLY
ncbi:MAG: RadC family protein [Treponema sp.]